MDKNIIKTGMKLRISWVCCCRRIIHLAISPEEMTTRLEKRANFDDKKEAIQKRLAIYRTKTVPVLEKYCNKVVHVSN
jgi:adenylate kinase family enzyme